MKKAKQTLTAALAATLATGALGTVAGASPIDDTFASTLKSVQKAQSEKTQTAINEARVAINAMPKELDWAKGEFSKQVDQVQQPLYTQIIDLIEKGKKEAKQETINEGRKLLVGVEDAYAKTWSSDFDTIQQTLVNNATEAVKAATKSQKDEDITKAEKLVEELKTSENADVKKSVEGMEKDLVEKIDIRVKKVETTNATTVQVTFSKDVDKDTINKDNFVVKTGNLRNYVTDSKLVDGKNNIVELTLQTKLDSAKEYNLTVSGVKDSKGGNLKSTTTNFKYDKKEIASVEFTSKKAVRSGNARDMLLIKDEAGRDITKEAKVTFECSSDKSIVTKDGKISSSAKIGKEISIRVYVEDKLFAQENVTIVENLAQTLIGFTISREAVGDDIKFADVTANNKMKVGTNNAKLTIFYKDALGNEKHLEGGKLKKIESLDKDIISVSGSTLNAKKEGIATIRVQYGDITEDIQVEVTNSNLETATLSMKDTSVSVARSDVEKGVRYSLVDNAFGDAPENNKVAAEVRTWNETRSVWELNDSVKVNKEDRVIKINGNKLKKDDISAKLIVTYQNVKYEQEFTINVSDAEKISSYKLVAENKPSQLGKEVSSLDQKESKHAFLKVYAIDENGNRINDAITNSDKTTMELYVDGNLEKETGDFKKLYNGKEGFDVSSLDLGKGDHQYYLRIVRNGVPYDTDTVTITVENTDDTSRNMDISSSITTSQALSSLFNWTYGNEDGDGKDLEKLELEFVSGDNIELSNGQSFKVVIKKINEAKTVNDLQELLKLTFKTKGNFEIKVNKAKVKVDSDTSRTIEETQEFPVTVIQ